MSSDDTNAFMEVLASCTEAAAAIDLSDDGFSPPDGTYTVEVTGIETGTKEKDGVTSSWVKPIFLLLDGEFKGQIFTNFFWIPGVLTDKNQMGLKRLLQFATCLAGTAVRNPIEAIEIANAAIGEYVSVEVYRSVSKSTGKVYVNTRFLQKLVATEQTSG